MKEEGVPGWNPFVSVNDDFLALKVRTQSQRSLTSAPNRCSTPGAISSHSGPCGPTQTQEQHKCPFVTVHFATTQ
jgi:hypothetical protein